MPSPASFGGIGRLLRVMLLLAGILAGLAMSTQAALAAKVVLNPTSAPVGATVSFDSGSAGWDDSVSVSLTLGGSSVGTCRSDGRGTLVTSSSGCTFTVPTVAPGQYALVATDIDGNSGSALFTVTTAASSTSTP